jgi:iron complex outermembrane recepter protein
MTKTRMSRWMAIGFCVLASWQGYAAEPGTQYQLNVPAQSVYDALKEFAAQTNLQVVYYSDVAQGAASQGVNGEFNAGEALKKILAGTGLTYQFLNERTVAIRGTRDAAVTAVAPTTPADDADEVRLAQADAQQDAANPEESSDVKLEEVVVTAQKREERLKDVPISVSVLGGQALDSATYLTLNDALRAVPGIASYNNAQSGMSKFSVRGVTSNSSIVNGGSTVGYYLDEIPFAFVRFPVSPDANAYDLERVEILRGPQGTLYGANSLNGVVRVLTHDADLDDTSLKARTTFSSTRDGGENYRLDAAANVPVVPGKLAVRAVAGYSDYDGWIDQPATGKENINDAQQKNYRLKVNAAPNENFNVELLGWLFRDERDAPDFSLDDAIAITNIPEPIDTRFDAYDLTIGYEFPTFSLMSSTSHMKFRNVGNLDTGPDRLITRLFGEVTSQEMRLSSTTSGPWKWSAGGIYRDGEDVGLSNFTGPTTAVFPSFFWNVYTSKSFALYGELSRMLYGNRLEVTAGLRYFDDDSASNELDTGLGASTPAFGKRSASFNSTTPRVVVSFRPSDALTLYTSYSEGFRSGFAQNGAVLRSAPLAPALQPDRLHNYEIGAKGRVLGGRLGYDLAGYYIDWKDTVQALAVTINNVPFFGAVNAKAVNGFGLDAAVNANLTDRLEIGATISWNDLAFVDDVRSGAVIIYPKDSRPVESPEYTAGGRLNYDFPVAGKFTGELSASIDYTARMLFRQSNGAPLYGDGITRARSSFSLISERGWTTMLFVDNITDEDGKIRQAGLPLGQADRLRPRTVGLQLDFRY